ncbi:hypothetical protein BDW02DRAFT_587351 [Decorospora gaudefroyi]|uniref:C2H2-type domain-containing protein n=1 Tax=Decorospora gaudefroyi TaxID=184978 RepID=A0A6A5KQ64_9PLEO|nr:hypothetical protein BDW02DRAFT_587351 [Decorospora gaudefroyi]
MSEPSETRGLPLEPTTKQLQQPKGNTVHQAISSHIEHRNTSLPSNDQPQISKTTSPRRRPGTTTQTPSGPHSGPSRSAQPSATSPTTMVSNLSSVHYTRTGRISKAKKGLKVHNCENCGRSYTRAEHLRRHQKNHAQDEALACDVPGCGKIFYRVDLLQRHQDRHNDPGTDSRQQSPEGSAEDSSAAVSALEPSNIATAPIPPPVSYYETVAAMNESAPLPRYTYNSFRTPQMPRTPQIPPSGFHAPRSSPVSTSSPNHSKHPASHFSRHTGAVPVSIDSMPPGLWQEPYSQSPGYSSSSGYASPIAPTEYPGVFGGAPYHRTRTPSNASFIDQPWSYPSRSPTSTTSTMAYTWSSTDKGPTASGLAYMNASYPMTSMSIATGMDLMADYGQFGPKTMAQRDEEEGVILFGDQQYGMASVAHTYPFEQYLDYYWRLFHPTFPIVHRSTFISPSPMLHAAMIAIGGQYSNDTSVKRKSRILHDRCMKLLERRDHEAMAEPDRLCDFQAMFLVEVVSQYRSRRAARVLSSRFDKVYHKAVEDFRRVTSQINEIVASLAQFQNTTLELWAQWIELATWQRLLLSCHVLESQQPLLLARESLPSLIQDTRFDLPFPGHTSLWDAATPTDWAFTAQQHSHVPAYVYEVTPESMSDSFDMFQSSVILAAHYNRPENSTPYLSSPSVLNVEHLLHDSPVTMRVFLTLKLVQVTPLRALLAVSGESWILSEKINAQAFTASKTTLRTWLAQLWSTTEPKGVPVKEALKLSVEILQQALKDQRDAVPLEMGTDMGIFFAALVLWAIMTAANTRKKGLQQKMQQHHRSLSQSPPIFNSTTWASVRPPSTQMLHNFPTSLASQSNHGVPCNSQPSSPIISATAENPLLSHAQITINTISFLSNIENDFDYTRQTPANYLRNHAGCVSLLLWVKLRLRGVPLEDRSGAADAWACKPGDSLGELLDGVTGSLERILNRGWGGWGI